MPVTMRRLLQSWMATVARYNSYQPVGSRVAKEFTSTGGTGREASLLSETHADARAAVLGLYRRAIQHIPQMRRDFNVVEEPQFLADLIRELFRRHDHVSDLKLIDMLIFKGNQELGEIVAQWKGRHHIMSYVEKFHQKKLREAALDLAASQANHHADVDSGFAMPSTIRTAKLLQWRSRGLIPENVETWDQYMLWKGGEREKFVQFVIQNKLFAPEDLEANEAFAREIGYMAA
uniref:NADH dehydrogenase [ubiquinone] 1 alpha subcomplex subunit 6 n=1 Tax=Compsopogon caeruleus TaxID=31354 RepID=A0A6T6CXR1_9RHOD